MYDEQLHLAIGFCCKHGLYSVHDILHIIPKSNNKSLHRHHSGRG